MQEGVYPGTYWPLVRITPIKDGGQAIPGGSDLDKQRLAFMKENAFNYDKCSQWVSWARQNYNGPLELDQTRKTRCDIDVCKVGCNMIGVSPQDALACTQACESGTLYANACEFLVTRQLDNQTLAAAGCGEQLTIEAQQAAAAAAKKNEEEAKAAIKKYLPLLLVVILILLLINYLR